MSEFDNNDEWLELSREATEGYRQTVYVGIHPDDPTKAIENAWELARRDGLESGATIRVIEQTAIGINPLTDHRVTVIIGS